MTFPLYAECRESITVVILLPGNAEHGVHQRGRLADPAPRGQERRHRQGPRRAPARQARQEVRRYLRGKIKYCHVLCHLPVNDMERKEEKPKNRN